MSGFNDDNRQQSTEVVELTKAINAESSADRLVELYFERAYYYSAQDDDARSVEDYLAALELAKKPEDKVHIKSMISLAFLKRDRKEDAIFWSVSAIEHDPQNTEGRHIFGLVCSYCDLDHVAIESLRIALTLRPENRGAMRTLGRCLRNVCNMQESIDVLSEYTARYPDDPTGLYELGKTYQLSYFFNSGPDRESQRVQQQAKALTLYQEALSKSPPPFLAKLLEEEIGHLRS